MGLRFRDLGHRARPRPQRVPDQHGAPRDAPSLGRIWAGAPALSGSKNNRPPPFLGNFGILSPPTHVSAANPGTPACSNGTVAERGNDPPCGRAEARCAIRRTRRCGCPGPSRLNIFPPPASPPRRPHAPPPHRTAFAALLPPPPPPGAAARPPPPRHNGGPAHLRPPPLRRDHGPAHLRPPPPRRGHDPAHPQPPPLRRGHGPAPQRPQPARHRYRVVPLRTHPARRHRRDRGTGHHRAPLHGGRCHRGAPRPDRARRRRGRRPTRHGSPLGHIRGTARSPTVTRTTCSPSPLPNRPPRAPSTP